MNEKTNPERQLSISVNGGTTQINTAFDNARVEAIQYANVDVPRLSELVENVRAAIPAELSSAEVETVTTNLEVIEEELKGEKPRKSFLKAALLGLKAIKETAEFGAAVGALFQFVQGIVSFK